MLNIFIEPVKYSAITGAFIGAFSAFINYSLFMDNPPPQHTHGTLIYLSSNKDVLGSEMALTDLLTLQYGPHVEQRCQEISLVRLILDRISQMEIQGPKSISETYNMLALIDSLKKVFKVIESDIRSEQLRDDVIEVSDEIIDHCERIRNNLDVDTYVNQSEILEHKININNIK
jgi:hypothetical protein